VTIHAYCTSKVTGWGEVEDVSTISDLRIDPQSIVWAELDVTDLGTNDVGTIGEEFGLDELAVEDAINPRQRPKLEDYERHHFAVLHQLDVVAGQLEPRQISCFVGDSYLLVIHHDADRTLDQARSRLMESKEEIADPSYLLYTLLDTVVDDYGFLADDLEESVETIEERALETADREHHRRERGRPLHLPNQQDLYRLKQQVARIRRFALPLENVLSRIVEHDDRTFIPKEMVTRFRDVYDHLVRLAAQARNIDELAQAVIELVRAEQANFLNDINKKLTAWAAILIVPTLIAGIYGMNYPLFPDGGKEWGFWFALGLMAVESGGLYLYFRNKEWL
jgi:magnesium transporter